MQKQEHDWILSVFLSGQTTTTTSLWLDLIITNKFRSITTTTVREDQFQVPFLPATRKTVTCSPGSMQIDLLSLAGLT